jgi:hypothetical protein
VLDYQRRCFHRNAIPSYTQKFSMPLGSTSGVLETTKFSLPIGLRRRSTSKDTLQDQVTANGRLFTSGVQGSIRINKKCGLSPSGRSLLDPKKTKEKAQAHRPGDEAAPGDRPVKRQQSPLQIVWNCRFRHIRPYTDLSESSSEPLRSSTSLPDIYTPELSGLSSLTSRTSLIFSPVQNADGEDTGHFDSEFAGELGRLD